MNRTESMKELNGESLKAESYALIKELARAAGVCAVSEKTKEELIAELVKINNGAQAACTAAAASGKNKE